MATRGRVAAQQGAAAAAAPAQTQFALAPALHPQQAGYIDYGTKEGQKLFYETSAPLPLKNKFVGKSSEIINFKQAILERGKYSGWDEILAIATGEGDEMKNLITHHGVLTDTMIRNWATGSFVGQESRQAQNNFAMYKCLSESISERLKSKLATSQVNCTVGGTEVAALFFKAIMNESEINTVATISTIQMQLSRLQESINNEPIAGDISKFNEYVKQKVQDLTCRGATYSGLVLNLFHAYKAVSDSDFVAYISLKETAFMHGEIELRADQLMSVAETDYKIRIEKGTWGQLSAEQQQIVALSAELERFKKKNNKKQNSNQDNNNQGTASEQGGDNKKGKGGKKSNKKKSTSKNKDINDAKWVWKKVPPVNGETVKNVDNKTYYFCPHHKAWTLHKPSDCRLNPSNSNNNTKVNNDNDTAFASALATIEAESHE